jgi:hypothetical protein
MADDTVPDAANKRFQLTRRVYATKQGARRASEAPDVTFIAGRVVWRVRINSEPSARLRS